MQLQIQNTCNNFGHFLRQFAFIKLGALMILKKNAASANKMQLQIQSTCNNFGHLLRQFAFIKLGALMIIKKNAASDTKRKFSDTYTL